MLGDLDKMLGNWKNKCSEKLVEKFGKIFPQLYKWGISRKKYIPDIPKCLRNLMQEYTRISEWYTSEVLAVARKQ